MDKPYSIIDGEWIKARLSPKRGEQKKLADFLGIEPDKLTKTLKGIRDVQPEEVPLLLEYFKERIVPEGDGEDINQQLGRLNKAGQAVLQRQLEILLERPEFVQSPENIERDA